MDAPRPDRRRVNRYKMKEGGLLFTLMSGHEFAIVKDMSIAGLGIEYVLYNKSDTARAMEVDAVVEVDLFEAAGDCQLSRIPCKVIYDISVNCPSFMGTQTRRIGLQYELPSDQQLSRRLKLFLSLTQE